MSAGAVLPEGLVPLRSLWHPGRHRLHQAPGAGFFGGEGFILQKLEGDGLVFVHAGGTLIRRQLNGETLRVDTGCLVAFTDGIDYDVQLAGA